MKQVEIGRPKAKRLFIGKGWYNTAKNGLEFLNISFDRGLEIVVRDVKNNMEYSLAEGSNIQGFANRKREGKKDPDIRLSFSLPATQ